MSKNSKRQQQAQNTRKKIYKAAVKLFKQYDYKNVSINDIVSEAGVSIGLFYNYFSCKEEIVLEEHIKANAYYQEIYDNIPSDINNIDKLNIFAKRIVEFSYEKGKEWIRIPYVTLIGSDKRTSYFADDQRPMYSIIHDIVDTGQKKGEIKKDYSPKEITAQIIASIYGNHFSWLADDSWDLVNTWSNFFSVYLEGLRSN